jgi:peroxiredoxin
MDQDRQERRLSDLVGPRGLVLCFFPFAFTSVCASEMQCVASELGKCRSDGLEVVGISCDSFAALKAWADQLGLKQVLLADLHRQVCRAYGLFWEDLNVARRGTVIIEKQGDALRVKWSQSREPGAAMELDSILAHGLA